MQLQRSPQTTPERSPRSHTQHSRQTRLLGGVITALALASAGRNILWDARLARAPRRDMKPTHGPFYPSEAQMRIYCDGKGKALRGGLNTGHCGVALRGNAHLPWVVHETGADDRWNWFSGTMSTQITGRWTPFDEKVISRTQRITASQHAAFDKKFLEYRQLSQKGRAWSVFHNCAVFAQNLWLQTTGENLPCQHLPFCTPHALAKAIIKHNNHDADNNNVENTMTENTAQSIKLKNTNQRISKG